MSGTTVVRDERELLARYPTGALPPVLMQEYIPQEHAEDWITHLYCGAGGTPRVVFTGLKLRSWPPYAGVTTRAVALRNSCLAELAAGLCRRIGYSGPADLDWRYDRRDGRYKLVDFNPRAGAQFRLFQNADGIDVVRAMHLDLTGRDVPDSPQDENRDFVAGQLDLPSAAVWLRDEHRLPPGLFSRRRTERAWLCRDDPLPAAADAIRFAGVVAHRLGHSLRRPGRWTPSGAPHVSGEALKPMPGTARIRRALPRARGGSRELPSARPQRAVRSPSAVQRHTVTNDPL